MLIIIEGMDGSGKTTLINALSERMDEPDRKITVLHSGQPNGHPLDAYVHRLATYDPRLDAVLADRWHIGELIYGPLYRGKSLLSPAMRLYVDMFLAKQGALKLFMSTPIRVVQHRLTTRGEDFLKPQHQVLVHDRYVEECSYLNGWTGVATSWRGSDVVLDGILDSARERERDVADLYDHDSYVGPPKPNVLVLGYRRPARLKTQKLYRQAFVPFEHSSAHLLLTALTLNQPVHSYGLANAGEEDLPALWNALGEPKIVTLGSEATSELLTQMPRHPYTKLNHPDFIHRLPAGGIHEYARFLRKAIDE